MADDAMVWAGAALLGLLVGSFLNVLIHRLPRMLQASWAAQAKTDAPAQAIP